MYVSNKKLSKYMKQNLIKLRGETGKTTIIAGCFNNPLSEIIRSSNQKISRDIIDLINTINQLDLIDGHRILHPTTADYTFFSD